MLRFGDDTWRALRRSGLHMVFFGAESGSDEVLRRMNKTLTTAQTLEVAARCRQHGIIPEFSFVLGGPDDPATSRSTSGMSRARRIPNDRMVRSWGTPPGATAMPSLRTQPRAMWAAPTQ